jgi:glucan phosphoethanolaminetransferase (alkaline phosphatase superfamily)
MHGNSFPYGFFKSIFSAYKSAQEYHLDNQKFRFHARRTAAVPEPETYVLVIGESASAAFWSLNGFPEPTTPRMGIHQSSGDLINFPQTVSQANSTWFAVPMIVTPATPSEFSSAFKSKSLLTTFKEVGFTTYWISNQDETVHSFEADFPTYLHPGRGIYQTNYDQDLWAPLEAALMAPQPKKFIVLHLMGSHTEYQARVPKTFKSPGLSGTSPLDHYLRSICYTDFVLDGFIQRLSRMPGRSFMWYVSDHGQTLRSGEIGHGGIEASVNELHVPMILWTNRAYREACSSRLANITRHHGEVLTQGVTFPSILGLAEIAYPGLDRTRDLASEAFIPGKPPEVLNGEARSRQVRDFLAKEQAGNLKTGLAESLGVSPRPSPAR